MKGLILKALTDRLMLTQFLLEERREMMNTTQSGGTAWVNMAEYDRMEGMEQGLLDAIAAVRKVRYPIVRGTPSPYPIEEWEPTIHLPDDFSER